eukprot:Rmarinus@m.11166
MKKKRRTRKEPDIGANQTAFRCAERKFKRKKHEETDMSDVLDLTEEHNLPDDVFPFPIRRGDRELKAFIFRDRPGLVVIPGFLSAMEQRQLATSAVLDFWRPPSDNNLIALDRFVNLSSVKVPPHTLRWATLGYHYQWTQRRYIEDKKSDMPPMLRLLTEDVLSCVRDGCPVCASLFENRHRKGRSASCRQARGDSDQNNYDKNLQSNSSDEKDPISHFCEPQQPLPTPCDIQDESSGCSCKTNGLCTTPCTPRQKRPSFPPCALTRPQVLPVDPIPSNSHRHPQAPCIAGDTSSEHHDQNMLPRGVSATTPPRGPRTTSSQDHHTHLPKNFFASPLLACGCPREQPEGPDASHTIYQPFPPASPSIVTSGPPSAPISALSRIKNGNVDNASDELELRSVASREAEKVDHVPSVPGRPGDEGCVKDEGCESRRLKLKGGASGASFVQADPCSGASNNVGPVVSRVSVDCTETHRMPAQGFSEPHGCGICSGLYGYNADASIINYYTLDQMMCAHVDDAEDDLSKPVVSLSLGCSGVFLVGCATRAHVPTALWLRSGDAVLLGGQTRKAYHGVPRIIEDSAPKFLTALEDFSDRFDPDVAEYLKCHRLNLNIRHSGRRRQNL